MSWNRPTLAELVTRAEGDLVSRLQIASTMLRRALVRIIARVHAGMTHGLHGHIDWARKQAFITTCDDDMLPTHGAELKLPQKLADYAVGPLVLSGTDGKAIQVGDRLVRQDGVEYLTTQAAAISGGTATVQVKATTAGSIGNAEAGTALKLVAPIDGINSTGSVGIGGLVNGVDVESPKNYRARLLQRKQNPPQGGSPADFERWALEVSGVTRAWIFRNYLGAGNVGVTFVCDDSTPIVPNSTKVDQVQTYIDDPARRPGPSTAIVYACTPEPVNFTITPTPDTDEVRGAIEAELADLLYREGKPDGTLLLSHIEAAISGASGETDHVLTVPSANLTFNQTQMPVMGTVTWVSP